MPVISLRVTENQKARWFERAEEQEFGLSEFIRAMTESGIKIDKGFDTSVQPDTSAAELKEQRNDLKAELDNARDRIDRLESQLYNTDVHEAKKFLENNPDAGITQLNTHIRKTTHDRMRLLLETDNHLTISND